MYTRLQHFFTIKMTVKCLKNVYCCVCGDITIINGNGITKSPKHDTYRNDIISKQPTVQTPVAEADKDAFNAAEDADAKAAEEAAAKAAEEAAVKAAEEATIKAAEEAAVKAAEEAAIKAAVQKAAQVAAANAMRLRVITCKCEINNAIIALRIAKELKERDAKRIA